MPICCVPVELTHCKPERKETHCPRYIVLGGMPTVFRLPIGLYEFRRGAMSVEEDLLISA